jgi:glycosyltransferase involved in cell wall biosynthesis
MDVGESRREDVATARVAIVLTCFNDGATLADTIESIRLAAATAELVIVDDGSTDDATRELLAQLAQQGELVISQANQGLAAAAAAGVIATTAPYVMRFDSDDLLEAGALDALADALDDSPGAAAAWGDVQTFGATSFAIPGIRALDPWLVTYANCITGSGVLMRRTALEAVGGWQLREGFEDWDVWMAIAERGWGGIYVPRVVFRYRRDRGGMLAGWLDQTPGHYDELRRRHPRLFEMRRANRRRSSAPHALKLLATCVEALPWATRLVKIVACEMFARLLWSGNRRMALRMIAGGSVARIGRRYGAGRD